MLKLFSFPSDPYAQDGAFVILKPAGFFPHILKVVLCPES